jgi:hypothetical protein
VAWRDGEPGGREAAAPAAGGGGAPHAAAGAVPAPGHRPQEAAPAHPRGQARAVLPGRRRPARRPRRVPHLLPGRYSSTRRASRLLCFRRSILLLRHATTRGYPILMSLCVFPLVGSSTRA